MMGQQQQPQRLPETQGIANPESHASQVTQRLLHQATRVQGYTIPAALLRQRLTWASTHRNCCRRASGHKRQGSASWQHASTLAAAASRAEMSTP